MALVHDSIGDFVLFPKDQSYIDMLDSKPDDSLDGLHYNAISSMQHQFSDLPSAAYDTYPSASAFSTSASSFYDAPNFIFDAPKESERSARRYTPSGPPSPSISHSFDHPPSVISSASGASVQSTASSVVGSPYSHATSNIPGQEQWTDSHQGLGIAPGIVHNEGYGHEIYPINPIENEIAFESNKFPSSFVGESKNLSSSMSTSCSISPLASSCLASQRPTPSCSSPSLVLDTSVAIQNVTIDTILNEVNSKIVTPSQTMSPAAEDPSKASPNSLKSMCVAHSPQQTKSSFRSPTTPASAKSPFTPRTKSPSILWRYDSHRDSFVCGDPTIPNSPLMSSNRYHPYGRPTPPSNSQAHCHRHESQSPFFSQSSGRFIPPLELSCWFSLKTLCVLFFFFSSLFFLISCLY